MKREEASAEARIVQPGKLKTADGALYVPSGIQLNGTWKVGLGSPTGDEYAPLVDGVMSPGPGGISIYQKAMVRRLTTGSLAEE